MLPQFESVFAAAGANPPPETQFVIAAAAFIRQYWLVGFVIVFLFALAFRFMQSQRKQTFDKAALNTPIFGRMLQRMETARYCRSLGEMLSGGLSLSRAMPIARAAINNTVIRNDVAAMENHVKNGVAFSIAAAPTHLSKEIDAFLKLGEETGAFGQMISKGAAYMEQRTATDLKRFAALSGPLMTAIMGLLTAGVIASVMPGVMSLNETIY